MNGSSGFSVGTAPSDRNATHEKSWRAQILWVLTAGYGVTGYSVLTCPLIK